MPTLRRRLGPSTATAIGCNRSHVVRQRNEAVLGRASCMPRDGAQSSDPLHERPERRPLMAVGQVGVRVDGYGDVGVAEDGRDGRQIHAVLDHKRCSEMPQIVKPDPWQPRRLERPLEPLGDQRAVQCPPLLVAEDEALVQRGSSSSMDSRA
jgi:hypothetical protein